MEKVIVNSLINNFKKDYETTPSFEDLLQDCINLKGITVTEFLVTSLQKGWLLNGGEHLDFSPIYNK